MCGTAKIPKRARLNEADFLRSRPISRGHIGTTRIKWANTQTDYEGLSLFMILQIRTRVRLTKKSFLLAPTGKSYVHVSSMEPSTDA